MQRAVIMNGIAAVALASVLAVGLTSPPSHEVEAAQQPPSFRAASLLVALQVTVRNGSKLVTGLGADDFAVFEDDVEQHVRFFESHVVPMDVMLLVDTSSSMQGQMAVVHGAATRFMSTLRPGDRGAVIAFSESYQVVQPLTTDHEAITRAIRSTRPSGATSLRTALYIALKQAMAPTDGALRRTVIVALTDGVDTSSSVSFEDVLALARNTGVNLYTITMRPQRLSLPLQPPDTGTAEFELRRLAEDTGAEAFFIDRPDQLRQVYQGVAAELDAKYSLAYAPLRTSLDPQFRRIAVRVTSNPGYRARARTGYSAEGLASWLSIAPRMPDDTRVQ